MRRHHYLILIVVLFALICTSLGCRTRGADVFTIALDSKIGTLDSIGAATVDANAERLRTLMFNTLIKKNEQYDYVGDLAKEINTSFDGTTLTFVLQDNVKFHDGKPFTSADAKYTLEALLKSNGAKATTFFEKINGGQPTPMIVEITTPDEKTLVLKMARPALKNNIMANLVAIPVVPQGSKVGSDTQGNATPDASTYTPPAGTGPYKFVRYDTVSGTVELAAHDNYWEGAPNIKQLRVKPVADANALQAELKSGRVQLAPMTINLSPDTLKNLGGDADLKVEQFAGANIQYLSFNTQEKPLDNVKVRQAIAYAVNRADLIGNLLYGQAKLAHSILPEESWAYSSNTKYAYDLSKAKQLLDEAGFKPDGNGNRFPQAIKFKIAAGNAATAQYAQVIQSQLKEIGIPVEIETAEFSVFLDQLKKGQYQMTTARYVGGNQDPIYLRDLFATSEIGRANRTKYSNPEFDKIVGQAVNETDREKAKQLYAQAQEIIARDVPLLPLWYPSNMVVSSKNVGSIKVQGSGDWFFVRNMTYQK